MSWLKILGYKAFLWVLGSNFSNFVILGLRWFMFLEKIKGFWPIIDFCFEIASKSGAQVTRKECTFFKSDVGKIEKRMSC